MVYLAADLKIQAKYRTAEEWASLDIRVQKTSGDLPRSERETTVAFINSERDAEVITCEASWMRRLERDGAVPQSIQVFEGGEGESRWYVIPKSWARMPRKPDQGRIDRGRAQAQAQKEGR